MAYDPTAVSHQEWLGYVQPVGVVVSIPALLEAGAAINRHFVPLHKEFVSVLPQDSDGSPIPKLTDFQRFAIDVLGWRPQDLEGPDESLTVAVPGYDEVLHPDYVVKDAGTPLLLICKTGADFDVVPPPEPRHWHASPQARFERLLRATGIPSGLLVSPDAIRLVYAPKGESSGHITFKISEMAQVAGRPILAALHMLLSAERLFALAQDQRLPALLVASRKHQNVVSNKLSGQVMEALFDLLRGFQSAHDQTGVLTEVLRDDPNQVYAGLLTVLLRLVFILYAEDRDLLSSDETFVNSYSVGGLFERLRADQAHNPDTMDQRYGAWAQLVVLFRLVYKGARHGKLRIPGRKGYLFDPDRYPFLEGRPNAQSHEIEIPRVPDGVLYRVLTQLLILDGERLSYRNLDVEQIGSVYEAMMGFELHLAQGPSIALKPKKRHGAPITINLTELLTVASAKRNEWLNKEADQKVTGQAERALKEASSVDDLIAALDRRIAKNVTPTIVPAGAMIFQPSAERRRSGSHYTPRSLTQPIVEAALAPVLKNLGENPRPEQLLALKVCDPAMGSGAFLVEACRQLGDVLVQAWHRHNDLPILPPDEDELLHARRLVAQQCLYGVDKNEMAVDLSKLSLWLATLARDHEFTFLDHSLRHGDSLVGFSAKQVAAFNWQPKVQETLVQERVRTDLARVADGRREILNAQDGTPYALLAQKLGLLEDKLKIARNLGDVLVSAFFAGKNSRTRDNARQVLLHDVDLAFGNKPDAEAGVRLDKIGVGLRAHSKPIAPFHWELEFPEVFALDRNLQPQRGFDAIVGNPPFMWGNRLSTEFGDAYRDWLLFVHPGSNGNGDLVAHFFRRSYTVLTAEGTFGLLATNSISETDTRQSGLEWLLEHGASIYRAERDFEWSGSASVRVALVCLIKGKSTEQPMLDGNPVNSIGPDLRNGIFSRRPERLSENAQRCFKGVDFGGTGFLLTRGEASSILENHPKESPFIWPVLNSEDVTSYPALDPQRWIINFTNLSLRQAEEAVGCMARVRSLVLPHRMRQKRDAYREYWWLYNEPRPGLYKAIQGMTDVIVNPVVSKYILFVLAPASTVFTNALNVLPTSSLGMLSVLQSTIHTSWALNYCSTLESRTRYNPSDCFETFPFPVDYELNFALEQAGKAYHDFRAAIMVRNNEGMTKIYNRFHQPDEQAAELVELRLLHAQMDRAVLDAYGWHDLQPVPAFFPELDEEDEENEGDRPVRARQKTYRYRWPEDIRDEVLARLLALNAERAALQAPPTTGKASKPKPSPQKHGKVDRTSEAKLGLFE